MKKNSKLQKSKNKANDRWENNPKNYDKQVGRLKDLKDLEGERGTAVLLVNCPQM